jgi:diguanylate cyclase (GGDEF)-like protein
MIVGQCPAVAALATGKPQLRVTMALRGEDGRVRHISIGAIPIRDGRKKRPAFVVASFVDLNAHNDANEALGEIVETGPEGFGQLKQESAKLRAVIEAFPGGIALYDAEFKMLTCNDKLRSLFALPAHLFEHGLPTLEDVLRSVASRGEYGPGDPEEHVRVRLESFKNGAHRFDMHRPDGRVFEIRTTRVDGGGLLVTHLDETARYDAQKRLQDSERVARETATILRSTLAHISQGLAMFDRDGGLLAWNDLYPAMYNFPSELMRRGTSVKAILEYRRARGDLDEDADTFIARFSGIMAVSGVSSTKSRLADGRMMSVVNTRVDGGGWVSTHEDITARERAEQQIAHLAYHDGLTGLLNRMGFRKRGESALARTRSSNELVSIVLVDLDRFKAVNDTHGHKAGDRLLISVADRLRANLRADDIVARLGGDEFAILLKGGSNLAEAATALSSRLVEAIGAPYELDIFNTIIGASIGVAVSSAEDDTIERLMHKADLALYEVKAQGRNAYCVYRDALGSRAEASQRIEQDLREAITQSALELYYQPIVELLDASIGGMEALVRWQHPIRGMVPPNQFIPVAEESGLIVPLSHFVIRRACLDAAKWPAHIKVSINISPAHLRKGGVAKMVMQACEEAAIRPTRLVIEVTETVLLQDDGGMLSELEQLKNIGLSIALDDFGTGFSSLSYLRMFPFDKIKIDKSFVSEMTKRSDSAAIVGAVAGLARSLDIITTAEGVETEDQLAMVKAAGCVQGQGYLFGKPEPIGAYLQSFAKAG